jgi:hypothetical protein
MKPARRNIVPIFLVVIFIISFAACSGAQAPGDAYSDSSLSPVMAQESMNQVSNPIGQTDQGGERIVIKNANLTIVVTDPAASIDRISRLAEEMGGFVVSADLSHSELNSGKQVPRGMVVIRVPVEGLNDALGKIRAESDQEPLSESTNSQDVTSEYTDLQSRLRNEEATEAQLTKIMQDATRTEDVLNVYNQLVQVRERIEVLKGQIKYYEESAALSSITTELLVDEAVQPLTVGSWQVGGVAKQAVQSLINTVKFLTKAFIWIVLYVLPVLLVIFVVFILPIWLLIRFWRRRRAQRKAAASNAPVEKTDLQP